MNLITVFDTHGQWAVKSISALLIYRKSLLSTTAVVTAFVCLLNPAGVYAQSQQVKASLQVVLNVRADNVVNAAYTIELTNNTGGLLNNMHFRIPATQLDGASCSIANVNCSATIATEDQFSTINLDFNVRPLRAGQTATVITSFDVKDLLKTDYGLKSLSLPAFEAGYESGDVTMQIKFPKEFGAPSYVSTDQMQLEVDNLQLHANSGFLVVWGSSASVEINEKLQFAEARPDDLVKFNLVPSLSQQHLLYNQLDDVYAAGIDGYLNVWGLYKQAERQPAYVAQVVIDSSQPVVSGDKVIYPTIKMPDDLADSTSKVTDVQAKAKIINDYLVTKLNPSHDASYSRDMLTHAGDEIAGGRSEIHLVEYALLAASYLQQAGVDVAVHYGYFLLDDLPGIDTAAPHAWVEARDGDKSIVVDPFFSEVTGFGSLNSPRVMRLSFGVWNPENTLDTMLGLLNGGVRLRPALSSISVPITNSKQYVILANMSSRVMAGGYYEGEMEVENKSAEFIRIKQISIGAHQVDSEDLRIAGDLEKLIMPLHKTTIQFVNLREPDYLLQGNVTLYLKFVPENADFATQETAVQIRFISDQRILVILLIAAGTAVLILATVLARLLIADALIKRNAKKQIHNISQDKLLAKPQLAAKHLPDPRPVQQFSRTHKL